MKSIHKIITLSIVLGLGLAIGYTSGPEIADAAISTEKYEPEFKDFPEGVYRYKVRWEGISVARASITVQKTSSQKDKNFYVRADARTVSGIDWLYKLRHRSESVFDAETFKPSAFYYRQIENRKHKYRQVYFSDTGEIVARRWKNGESKANTKLTTNNDTLDPMSAAFIARSLPIEKGKVVEFDIYNGKRRYLIEFNIVDIETLKTKRGEREAFKVVPFVTRIKDDGKFEKEDKLKSATIWVSTDKNRDILKIKSSVVVGSVVAELESFHAETPTIPAIIDAKIIG